MTNPTHRDRVEEILRTEFSEQFTQGMKDRMVVSYYKYGRLSDAYPDKVDALSSLLQRLKQYKITRNTEFLIDAANFAMIEFMHPKLQGAFFAGTDDAGSPGRTSTKTGKADHRNNDEIDKNPHSITAKFR